MPLGLYISVPFCRTKCSYCNFASDVFSKSAYENYVARLLEDIAGSRQLASERGCALGSSLGSSLNDSVDSIYLGGGTPSILQAAQLLRIFAAVRGQFAVTPDAEITVECAPGTLTPALIETLLQCGVNRVSLGVQSFVDQEAQSVGRLHKRTTVLNDIDRLRTAGLGNINIDLIAGLPHQTADSWAFSVSETIAAGVPHVSVYMLEVDDDSRLGRELIAGGARYHAHFVPDEDATADFYEQACQMLASAGLAQYEISNFARVAPPPQNNESRHNLKYWTRQPYLGFGVDAHSFLPLARSRVWGQVWGRATSPVQAERSSAATSNAGLAITVDASEADRYQALRFATPDSLDAYMSRAPHTVTPVTAQAAIEESFFLGLRLNRGIDLERLHTEFSMELGPASFLRLGLLNTYCHPERTGVPIAPAFGAMGWGSEGPAVCRKSAKTSASRRMFSQDAIGAWESAIHQCLQEGLLEQQGTILRLTGRGRLLSNEVFARFLTEEGKGKAGKPVT